MRKINKMPKPLARLIMKKGGSTQVRNEKGKVTTDTTEIQRLIKTTTSNYMPRKWKTWKKWTNS